MQRKLWNLINRIKRFSTGSAFWVTLEAKCVWRGRKTLILKRLLAASIFIPFLNILHCSTVINQWNLVPAPPGSSSVYSILNWNVNTHFCVLTHAFLNGRDIDSWVNMSPHPHPATYPHTADCPTARLPWRCLSLSIFGSAAQGGLCVFLPPGVCLSSVVLLWPRLNRKCCCRFRECTISSRRQNQSWNPY